jgi:hypothetical protein
MLRPWGLALLTILGGCHAAAPPDCDLVSKKASGCFRRFEGTHDDRKMLLTCFPFSEPERMRGAWVTGFELNSFYEGAKASADLVGPELTPNPDPRDVRVTRHATLVFAPRSGPTVPVDGKVRVLQVEFIGRRELCPILPPDHTIVVDRIVSASIRGVAN